MLTASFLPSISHEWLHSCRCWRRLWYKSQTLRMPNLGKSQGPSSPVSDGHHPSNLSCHMVFPLPSMLFPSLPHTLTLLAALFLGDAARMSPVPWNLCLQPLARCLAPPSTLTGPFTHTQTSTAALITSGFHHLFTICLLLTCELPQPSTALKNDLLMHWLTK